MENMSDKNKMIINAIQRMSGKYSVYEIFADWVKIMALSFANQVQYSQSREDDYVETVKKYSQEEMTKLIELMAWLVEWADEQYCDMLGYIYMHLELGSKSAGQFFTPYNICRLMAELEDISEEVTKVNEPTCGAGGNIIALADVMKSKGINYQHSLLAICQDIDIKAVYMTYVQLSLYGIPAIVYQTNTLLDPNGNSSTTGELYTVGYMLNPHLWKERSR